MNECRGRGSVAVTRVRAGRFLRRSQPLRDLRGRTSAGLQSC